MKNEDALAEAWAVLIASGFCSKERRRKFKGGSTLFEQGDNPEHWFMIESGRIKLFSISSDGKSLIYGIAGPGGLLGDVALVLGGRCVSTAQAVENSVVYAITQSEFMQLLEDSPAFSKASVLALCNTVVFLSKRIQDLIVGDVRKRLVHLLERLADEHGVPATEGIRIDVELTHEEIAELVGADRSTITLHLSELERQRYLHRQGRRIILLSKSPRAGQIVKPRRPKPNQTGFDATSSGRAP